MSKVEFKVETTAAYFDGDVTQWTVRMSYDGSSLPWCIYKDEEQVMGSDALLPGFATRKEAEDVLTDIILRDELGGPLDEEGGKE